MNGIDVSKFEIGDVLELSNRDAKMMIQEGWAEEVVETDGPISSHSENPIARKVTKRRRPSLGRSSRIT
jgi:hypothetical protein